MEDGDRGMTRPLVRCVLAVSILAAVILSLFLEGNPFPSHFHPVPRLPALVLSMALLSATAYGMSSAGVFGRWALELTASGSLLVGGTVALGLLITLAATTVRHVSGEAGLGVLLVAGGLALVATPFLSTGLISRYLKKKARPRPWWEASALVLEAGAVLAILFVFGGTVSSFARSVKRGETLLAWASREGKPGLVRFLLDRGALPNTQTTQGETPLVAAVAGCYPARDVRIKIETIQLLLQAGGDPNLGTYSPLMTAIGQVGGPEMAKLLLENRADPNKGNWGITPLRRAVEARDVATTRCLISAGARVDDPGQGGLTPLMLASAWPHYQQSQREIVKVLLESGARLDARDEEGRTPLHWGAIGRDAEVVRLLLEAGGEPLARDKHGRIPADLLGQSQKRLGDEFMTFGQPPSEALKRLLTGRSDPP